MGRSGARLAHLSPATESDISFSSVHNGQMNGQRRATEARCKVGGLGGQRSPPLILAIPWEWRGLWDARVPSNKQHAVVY
jgi:hypothetical protein